MPVDIRALPAGDCEQPTPSAAKNRTRIPVKDCSSSERGSAAFKADQDKQKDRLARKERTANLNIKVEATLQANGSTQRGKGNTIVTNLE